MKKKIVSLFLTLCMLVTLGALASCGEKSTAEIVRDAVEKTNALDSYAADMALEISMEASGVTMSIPVDIDMTADNVQSGKPNVFASATMEMFGISVEFNIYSDSEWIYIDMVGEKYKTKLEELSKEFDYSAYTDGSLTELSDELLADKELIKNEDGSQSVTVTIPPETFAQLCEDIITSMNSATDEAVLDKFEIADAVLTITIADDYVKTYDLALTLNMVTEDVETSVGVKAVCTFKEPGTDVTVTAPEGLDEYVELSEEDLA